MISIETHIDLPRSKTGVYVWFGWLITRTTKNVGGSPCLTSEKVSVRIVPIHVPVEDGLERIFVGSSVEINGSDSTSSFHAGDLSKLNLNELLLLLYRLQQCNNEPIHRQRSTTATKSSSCYSLRLSPAEVLPAIFILPISRGTITFAEHSLFLRSEPFPSFSLISLDSQSSS